MNNNIKRMADMNVKKLIMVMSLPAIISMFVQALYNFVDSVFIAKISEQALIAVSQAFPVQMIMISVIVGLSIGLNSYVSRKLGEGDKRKAAAAAEHGIVLGIVIWILFCVFDYFLVDWFFSIFSSDPLVIKYAKQYTNIVVFGSLGMIMSMILISIKQATGDMVNPMKIQLVGAVVNMILDPIMIFGLLSFPQLDVIGAGLATVCGQFVSMIYALIKLKHNPLDLKISKLHINFKLDWEIIIEVMRVGLPSMLIQGLGAFMVGNVNYILAGFSEMAVAAFGAFFKVNTLFFMPLVGLTQGMMPVVGYNYGAKNSDRVKKAIKYSMMYSLGFMIIGSLSLQLFAEPIMYIFSEDSDLVALGAQCMRIISPSFILFGVTIIIIAAFQAFGIARLSLYSTFLRQLILLIPLAHVLSWFYGVTGVWFAFPLTETASLVFILAYAYKLYQSKIKPAMIE